MPKLPAEATTVYVCERAYAWTRPGVVLARSQILFQ